MKHKRDKAMSGKEPDKKTRKIELNAVSHLDEPTQKKRRVAQGKKGKRNAVPHTDEPTKKKQKKENISAKNQKNFEQACEKGDTRKVQALLQKIDPTVNNNAPLLSAVTNNHFAIVEMLLKDPRVDPTVNNNAPLQTAMNYNYFSIVIKLLQDRRVDPTINNNAPLQYAFNFGYDHIVDMLLKDPRVDPTFNQCFLFRCAIEINHQIIQILLVEWGLRNNKIELLLSLDPLVFFSSLAKNGMLI